MNIVSIVIINYNSSKYTLACIGSILKQTKQDLQYEVIIVDNASSENDFGNLKALLPNLPSLKLIRSRINLGFSGGNMLGMQHCNGKYFLFLNNDCEFLNDNLTIYYKFMEAEPSAGICTGQMFNTDLSFHHSFNYFPKLSVRLFGSGMLRLLFPKSYPSKKIHYSNPVSVPSITGAAMFVRSEAFSGVGGFDTSYFLYCEEEDLCYRMRQAGYEVYLVPDAQFVHHMGKSTSRNLAIRREYYISLFYFFRKNYCIPSIKLLSLLYFFKHFKKSLKNSDEAKLAFFILKGAPARYSLRFKQKFI
jgi:GT2 family glycosyltransferase